MCGLGKELVGLHVGHETNDRGERQSQQRIDGKAARHGLNRRTAFTNEP